MPLAQKGLLLILIETPAAGGSTPQIQEGGHRLSECVNMHDNYMHALTLDELAQVVALSPYHFQAPV